MRLPRELSSALLNRAHRASLHRLRGVVQILGGWATLGTPEPAEEKIRVRMNEVQILADRMNLLWQLQGEEQPDCSDPLIISAILAGAMHAGTPEEAGDRLPLVEGNPEAALALSGWLEAVSGSCALPKIQLTAMESGGIRARANGQPIQIPNTEFWTACGEYLQAEIIPTTELGVGASVLIPELAFINPQTNPTKQGQAHQTEKGSIAS